MGVGTPKTQRRLMSFEDVRGGGTAVKASGNHSYCYHQFLEEILPVH
jgi:hypothetical protein